MNKKLFEKVLKEQEGGMSVVEQIDTLIKLTKSVDSDWKDAHAFFEKKKRDFAAKIEKGEKEVELGVKVQKDAYRSVTVYAEDKKIESVWFREPVETDDENEFASIVAVATVVWKGEKIEKVQFEYKESI